MFWRFRLFLSQNHTAAHSVIYIFLAPLCPTPPAVPEEGEVEHTPKIVELEPEEDCGIDSEDIQIICPTFLRQVRKKSTYWNMRIW